MSTKFNHKELNINLKAIKENFIGCTFVCKSISVNIPDKFATCADETMTNQFCIDTKLLDQHNQNFGKVLVYLDTKNKHTVQDKMKDILNDVIKQKIYFLDASRVYNSVYSLKTNNYIIQK